MLKHLHKLVDEVDHHAKKVNEHDKIISANSSFNPDQIDVNHAKQLDFEHQQNGITPEKYAQAYYEAESKKENKIANDNYKRYYDSLVAKYKGKVSKITKDEQEQLEKLSKQLLK